MRNALHCTYFIKWKWSFKNIVEIIAEWEKKYWNGHTSYIHIQASYIYPIFTKQVTVSKYHLSQNQGRAVIQKYLYSKVAKTESVWKNKNNCINDAIATLVKKKSTAIITYTLNSYRYTDIHTSSRFRLKQNLMCRITIYCTPLVS